MTPEPEVKRQLGMAFRVGVGALFGSTFTGVLLGNPFSSSLVVGFLVAMVLALLTLCAESILERSKKDVGS